MAHVEQRARAERAHVVRRDIGVARHDPHALRRDIEHLADDLRHGGIGALAHVDGAAIERGAAVGRDGDIGDRGRRRDHRLDGEGDAAAVAHYAVAVVERFAPVQPLGHAVEHGLELGVLHDLAGGLRSPFVQEVLAAELERIELERARDHVGVALVGPHQLRNAEAAQRPGRRLVGVERVRIDPDVVDVVGARGGKARLLRHSRPDVGVGAAVPVYLAFARGDAAALVDAGLDAAGAGMAGDGVELLLHGQRDLDRSPRDHGERGRERFHLDVELRAEAAAEIGHLDAHPVLRPAEQARDLGAHERGALGGGVDRDASLVPICDRHKRLEREVKHLLRVKGVLEHVRGLGEGLVDIAPPQLEIERDVGALATLEVLEIGEGAGRLEFLVHQRLVFGGLDLVEDRRQFLVFCDDELRRLLGHVRVGGEHDRDRFADEVHLVDRQDRLVVECRPVIGGGDDLAHVF